MFTRPDYEFRFDDLIIVFEAVDKPTIAYVAAQHRNEQRIERHIGSHSISDVDWIDVRGIEI